MYNQIKKFKFSIIFVISVLAVFSYKKYSYSHNEQNIFEKIYKENHWGKGSGPGSNPDNARPYLDLLQKQINDDKFKTIVDLGCGDWQLMETITIPSNKQYRGYDVVKSVIENNFSKYSKENVKFFHISKLDDFSKEKGDLLIVKDVIQHWPSKQVLLFIEKILPNFKYALITNDYDNTVSNGQSKKGSVRAIDLEKSPFDIHNDVKVLTDYSSHGLTKRVYFYTNPRKD